ncbi:MAG: flagellar hook-length control protein FliK [Pseudomonadota bacterium]
MVDDVKKSEATRQERIRQQAIEKAKPKTAESEFDKQLKKGQMPQAGQAAKEHIKPVTEQAMEEAAKRQERQREMREKEKEERKEKKETRQTGERADATIASQKVVGKGGRGQGGRGQSGGGKQGGYDGSTAKRGLSKMLTKAGVKTIPMDLQKQFAAKMARAAKEAATPSQAALTQHVLDKIVQYVRIGINRSGDKEIQVDLHQKIFRGLKLRVIAREGKVGVHFRTSDKKGREIFEKNSDAIRDALAKKGIEVDEITIA